MSVETFCYLHGLKDQIEGFFVWFKSFGHGWSEAKSFAIF